VEPAPRGWQAPRPDGRATTLSGRGEPRRPKRGWRELSRRLRRALQPPEARRLASRLEALERELGRLANARHPELLDGLEARLRLGAHEFRVHSQNGEDGLLLHLLAQLGAPRRRLVELGCGDGRECNAANLILHFGWGGLLVDHSAARAESARRFYGEECGVGPERLRVVQRHITAENADATLREHGPPGEIDLLSIDLDGNDYWVWKALGAVAPRIVCIEYNASLGPEEDLVALYDPDFDRFRLHPRGWYHGASLAALTRLGAERGYALVGCESAGVNAFFVRKDLLGGALRALCPADAFHPDRRRLRHASQEEQRASLRGLPFAGG
jgi:hypothetical protein